MRTCVSPQPAPKRMCFASIANAQRLKQESDMKLVFPDGRAIWMHTMVAREFFPGLSSAWLKQDEAQPWVRVLEVTSFDADVVRAVVDFAYTGEVPELAVADAVTLLRAAHYFGAEPMVHRLCAWLGAHMTKHDSVFVYESATRLCEHDAHLAALREAAMRLIGTNAHELNDAQLEALVADLRYVVTEQVVCDLALAFAERARPISSRLSLLHNVNFGRLPARYREITLSKLVSDPALDLALSTHVIRTQIDPAAMRRRYCLSGTVVTVSESGWASAFCLATGVTYTLPPVFATAHDPETASEPAEPVVIDDDDEAVDCDAGLAVAYVARKVLVSLVVRSGKRAAYALDLDEWKWRFVGVTQHALRFSACAVLDDEVHLLGGSDSGASRSSEKRTPDGTWVDVERIPYRAAKAAACVVDGKLLFLGGLNADGALDEVVQLSANGTFRSLGKMRDDRFNFAVAAVGTKVFCVGGGDHASFEVFDTATGEPRRLADSPEGNWRYHTAFSYDGFVYAASAKNLERYSIETDTWHNVSRSFPLGVAAVFVP